MRLPPRPSISYADGPIEHGDERLPLKFWENVLELESGCWLWTARTDRHGYAYCGRRSGTRLAHRVCYEALVGPIPLGLHLDHLCRNTSCVNPKHLEPVTPGENHRRARTRGPLRRPVVKSHPEVRHGQIWANKYGHERGRTVVVESVESEFVTCRVQAVPDGRPRGKTGYTTRLRITGLQSRYRLASNPEVSS